MTDQKKQLPQLLIIPSVLLQDSDIRPIDGYVYALVYWFSKMLLQRCVASNSEMAERLGINIDTVSHALTRLARKGYVKVILGDRNQRIEVIPMVEFIKGDVGQMAEGVGQATEGARSNGRHNNNIKQEDLIKDSPTENGAVAPAKGGIIQKTIDFGQYMDGSKGTGNGDRKMPVRDITAVVLYFKEKMGLSVIDGSEKQNRWFANHCLKKFGGLEKVKMLIDVASKDRYWSTKVTSLMTLHRNAVRIISETRQGGGVMHVE